MNTLTLGDTQHRLIMYDTFHSKSDAELFIDSYSRGIYRWMKEAEYNLFYHHYLRLLQSILPIFVLLFPPESLFYLIKKENLKIEKVVIFFKQNTPKLL